MNSPTPQQSVIPQQQQQPQQQQVSSTSVEQQQQQQQQQQQLQPRPLYQYQVTKLRSWRTGYVRLLVLYENEFATLDPTSVTDNNTFQLKETNRWPYSALTDWMAVPNDNNNNSILLQVDVKDKLKFTCHGVSRSIVLTRLLQIKHLSGQSQQQQRNAIFQAQRWKRDGSQHSVLLQIQPFGIQEIDSNKRTVLQTYLYKDIRAVSFPKPNENIDGIFFHFIQEYKIRLYTNCPHRTNLLQQIQENCTILGIDPLPMEPSRTVHDWVQQRTNIHTLIGTIFLQWNVTKLSKRHDHTVLTRQLAITGNGYIVEMDYGRVVNVNLLCNIQTIVRPSNTSIFRIEYNNGIKQQYNSAKQHRDTIIVSILDASKQFMSSSSSKQQQQQLKQKSGYHAVHFTDNDNNNNDYNNMGTFRIPHDEEESNASSTVSSLFQPTPVPQYTLKRIYTIGTHLFALTNGEFGSVQQSTQHQQELKIFRQSIHINITCHTLQYACYEFNASFASSSNNNNSNHNNVSLPDKQIVGTMGALFGLLAILLNKNNNNQQQQQLHMNNNVDDANVIAQKEGIASTFLQTILTLAQTPVGYRCSADLTTLRECLPWFWYIKDDYCKYSAFSVLNALLSGTNKDDITAKRDMEAEYVNKNVLLKIGGTALIDGLVSSLLPNNNISSSSTTTTRPVSDLTLMVTSDILQSLLCSYHDTTSPEHFQAIITSLMQQSRGLLSLLRSQTPFIIENTALLLHLLSTHAPNAAAEIRDASLSSAIILQHFYAATFSPLEGQRFLSRFLCSLWFSGPMQCDEKRLLKRMIPHGFLAYLNMPQLSRMEEEQLDELERDAIEGNITDQGAADAAAQNSTGMNVLSSTAGGTNTARLRTRVALASGRSGGEKQQQQQENFRIFFHVLTQDHTLADLIWSQQTRRELRIALESELEYIRRVTEAKGYNTIAWNHQQFIVHYPSLDNEVKVGDVYMRLWLQAGDGFIRSWDEPVRLFEHLFRRFLCEIDRNTTVTVMCIRCLERLYANHAAKIGPFTDVMILVHSMGATKSVEVQHRLLGLLSTVLGVSEDDRDERYDVADVPENAEQLLNVDSISQLCHFVAWGHTNGDQIGNVLTRALAVGMNGKLLTDGTDSGPQGNEGAVQSTPAKDLSCPPVWYVASTGRIPPPSEAIRGPFRISDLTRMMAEGDLSPYDLITSSHVEEYDTEAELENLTDEKHIDTGKWRRLIEVWQLSWQLCSDGTSSAIYSASDVALLSLKSLTRLVELHRSLDSRGVPYVPIPTAKRILCGSSWNPNSTSDTRDVLINPLPILCQALLCNDSRIIEQAAELIHKLCQHNEKAVSKLYLTGVFFFALSYTGSNFKVLAKLLHATHLEQHFKSGFAAAANDDEITMKERSILGTMLPEGLLFILVNYGVDRFSEIFVGNADTPEVIWTFEMRKHLIEMIRQHLGDFPLRLIQNTTMEYEYCPMPGVAYRRLEKEIFCHNYYLHNLCDEVRFRDWPISEPVELFRACLERLKKQLDYNESSEEEALEKARKVLDLKAGDGSKELRKAYRSLARLFHPDKNPAGREKFESIQTSYERLLPLVERGEKIRVFAETTPTSNDGGAEESTSNIFPVGKAQMQIMHLLIKTQVLICRRYENEMSRQKYPAYAILLSCLNVPASPMKDDFSDAVSNLFVSKERSEIVSSASELVFRTCVISPQNAEELTAERGVSVLANLLGFYIKAFEYKKKYTDSILDDNKFLSLELATEILTFTVRTLAGVAFYESGRDAVKSLTDPSLFLINWKRCLDGSTFSLSDGKLTDAAIRRYAIEGVSNLASDPSLQENLVGCGILWPLLRFVLSFDPTLEHQSSELSDQDDLGLSVASSNIAARLSVRALGVLSGIFGESPENEKTSNALFILLTKPVAKMLRNKRTSGILRILNTNVERADIIWNVEMRNQLDAFLTKTISDRPAYICRAVDEELKEVNKFSYDVLQNEIRIGGIYIRFFNRDGKDALPFVESPNEFFDAIVCFLTTSMNKGRPIEDWVDLHTEDSDYTVDGDNAPFEGFISRSFVMAMTALRILCRVDGLLEDAMGRRPDAIPSLFLSFLELPLKSEGFETGCDILNSLCSREFFADAVTQEGALWRLLALLERSEISEKSNETDKGPESSSLSNRKARAWSVLESLSSSPSIASHILATSGWIELLGVLVGYSDFTKSWPARVGAAKTISRLLWDPNTGSLAETLLKRFLPPALAIRLKEDAEGMVKDFDSDADTPELIWDSSMRGQLRKVLAIQLDELLKDRIETAGKPFMLAPTVTVQYTQLENELYIGNVYVSRFLKEPTCSLRDPTSFLELLLQRWKKELDTSTSNTQSDAKTSDSNALIIGGQDILETVTTSVVYLCKVHDTLCDRLASWGYMETAIDFLDRVLEASLTGTPLISTVRLLHVAAGRKVNVEALALVGHTDGYRGVVDFSIKSIGREELHRDSAFMIEMLKKVFELALGDLQNVRPQSFVRDQHSIMMAPSPAPGEGPVRKRVSAEEDPLGMFQPTNAPSVPQSNASLSHITGQSLPQQGTQQSHMPFQQRSHVSQAQSSQQSQTSFQQRSQMLQPQSSQQPQASFQQRSHMLQPQSSQQSQTSFQQRSQMVPQTSFQQRSQMAQPQSSQQQQTSFQQRSQMVQAQSSQPSMAGSYQQSSQYPPSQTRNSLNPTSNGMLQTQQVGQSSSSYQARPIGSPDMSQQRSSALGATPNQRFGVPQSQPQMNQQQQQQQNYPSRQSHQTPTQGWNTSQQQSVQRQQLPSFPQVAQPPSGQPSQQQNQQYSHNQFPRQQPQSAHQQFYSPQTQAARNDGLTQQFQANQQQYNRQQGNTSQQQSSPQQFQQMDGRSQIMSTASGSSQYNGYSQHPNQNQTSMNDGRSNLRQGVQQYPNSPSFQDNQMRYSHDGTASQGLPAQHAQMYQQQQPMTSQAGSNQTFSSPQQIPVPQGQSQGFPGGAIMQQNGAQEIQGAPGMPGQNQGFDPSMMMMQNENGMMIMGPNATGHESVPIVETVTEPAVPSQYGPTAVEGAGIDARSEQDPKIVAEQTASITDGAPGALHGRVALLRQALTCKLCEFLVDDVLENPTLHNIRDSAAAKVHAIDLIKMLTKDPGYGPKFKIILNDLPAWKKYKSQDHTLLITGHEQKADYFLTDGGSVKDKKLLKDG